ncbi:RagB/SusD family nutrient uptake outer membrane protein [Sphingobacterium sp. Mn56C]|uniref:RagB/SusD family nutrient uptake outer membrane protein n=1 Tax=Sphingobacterium sp. Mn56C TaxID=3395261 RepID=UPI003BD6248F
MKIFKYIIAGLFLSTTIQSCNLDKFPEDSIERSNSFEKLSDAEKWTNNFYAQLRGRIYGTYTQVSDVQTDLLNATREFGNVSGAVHRWGQDFNSDSYEVRDIWLGYYAALKNVNISIEKFPAVPVANETEKTKLNQYLSEAYLTRAYYYSQLALRYCKAYDPATADKDLGVPLVTKFDVNEKPARATLKQTYEFILSDIVEAKKGLAQVSGTPGSIKFTIDAALALEARVKLYMGDLVGAKTAAEQVIAKNTYKLFNTAQGVASIWAKDEVQETIMQLFATSAANERPNSNDLYFGYNADEKTYRSLFIPSKWVIDAYEDKDYRKAAYFKEVTLDRGGLKRTVFINNKFPGNPSLNTSAADNYNKPKVFRVAELYLIVAEATAKTDAATSLSRLNELRVARGLDALTGLTGENLLNAVKDERLRELAFEGFRLDDLKRWKLGMTRRDPQDLDILQTGQDGFYDKSVPATDNKFVWGIPSYEIILNDKLVQNQGW